MKWPTIVVALLAGLLLVVRLACPAVLSMKECTLVLGELCPAGALPKVGGLTGE